MIFNNIIKQIAFEVEKASVLCEFLNEFFYTI